MNILTIGVLALLILFSASGWKKGLVNKLAGIVALLLSSFLVSAALPYITEFLKNVKRYRLFSLNYCNSRNNFRIAFR